MDAIVFNTFNLQHLLSKKLWYEPWMMLNVRSYNPQDSPTPNINPHPKKDVTIKEVNKMMICNVTDSRDTNDLDRCKTHYWPKKWGGECENGMNEKEKGNLGFSPYTIRRNWLGPQKCKIAFQNAFGCSFATFFLVFITFLKGKSILHSQLRLHGWRSNPKHPSVKTWGRYLTVMKLSTRSF